MGFRINTNIAALNAHNASSMNNKNLDNSLSRLSSGLRINKAADDASGMAIADSLRAQANGLGQAINNANDGVAVVQTADGALDEYIGIINTVRTKAIQAASDGQNSDSRTAIQADIDRLLEAADSIANTTQFNGQKLLDGTFTNKAFHIGAYAAETVSLSVGNVQVDTVGDINGFEGNNTRAALISTDYVDGASGQALKADTLTINGTDVAGSLNTLSPTSLTDASSVAAAITDATGLLAQGSNTLTGATAIAGGTIDSTNQLKINGIAIADTTVVANDSDGALRLAINNISDQTGVTASVDSTGKLLLESNDGSNISITTSSAQSAVAQVSNIGLEGTVTTGDTILATVGAETVTATYSTDFKTTAEALATALESTSGIASATYTAASESNTFATGTTSGSITVTANGTSYTLASAAHGNATAIADDLVTGLNGDAAFSALFTASATVDGTLVITSKSGADAVDVGITYTGDTGPGTTATNVAESFTATGPADGTAFDITLDASGATGITAATDTIATVGQAEITSANASSTVTGLTTDNLTDQTGTAVSTLTASATANVTIAKGELIINGTDMAGTYGDNVTAGTAAAELEAAIQAIDGMGDSSINALGVISLVVNNGDDLNIGGTTGASTYNLTEGITNESKIGKVNIFSDDAIKVAGTASDSFGLTSGTYAPSLTGVSLDSIDVTTRESAEVAILITDSALKQLDATRSDLGSVQNQLESTIRNISVTQVNVTAAESQIRDVDFAAESANFSKFNILAQSGSYAMSQANAVQQNVLRLLQ